MKKKNWSNIVLVLILLLGVSLLLYPTVSDYWNSLHQTQAIAVYEEQVTETDDAKLDQMLQEAEDYNARLASQTDRWNPSEEAHAEYEKLLDLSGSGVMGALEIPSIKVSLPIYHGIEESVLQIAAGHIEGSSLPTGGPGTHTVISGHRGLPSARLLTDLDKLTEGDRFLLKVLNRVLTYEVDQIRIVEPEELNDLKLEEGKDYCTLVTCTPYGVNSHRLLVRGHRVENEELSVPRVTSDALQVEPLIVAAVLAAILLLILILWVLIFTGRRPAGKKKGKDGVEQ